MIRCDAGLETSHCDQGIGSLGEILEFAGKSGDFLDGHGWFGTGVYQSYLNIGSFLASP